LIEVDSQCIARLCTFDVKRSCLRITPLGNLLAAVIEASCVNRRRYDGIPVVNTQHRFMRAESPVITGWCEVMVHIVSMQWLW
jgi:hypothetical protein